MRLTVEPLPRAGGETTAITARAVQIPPEFRGAVEAGLRDGIMTGVLGRYPLTDLNVRVTDGAFDPEASTEVAFRTAAVMAFREAVAAAQPELLEPIMSLEIVTPGEYMGDVLGDINARRGKIREMAARGTTQIVRASVPLAEVFGYATAIRSLTRGRASYTLEPEQFEIVPKAVREQLLNR